jgi:Putative MetA-pathway of phenol degradation
VTALGLGDVELSALLQLLEQDTQAVDLVASMELILPTGSERRGLGGGQLEIGASLGMAITRSAVTWQGTVGYSLAPGDLEQELEADLSVALALPAALHAYVELSGETDLPDFELQLALGPAVRWAITPQLAMSAGALFGVTQAATPLRFIIEAQQEF